MQYLIDLDLDGYETEKEMNEACKEFIYDQFNMTASSVSIIEDKNVHFKVYNNEIPVSISLTEEKKNKIIQSLIRYMQENDCVDSEKLLQNDDCIMEAPVTLAEMIEILEVNHK